MGTGIAPYHAESRDGGLVNKNPNVLSREDAVRQIRARGSSTPIIAVTAYAMRADRDECLAIGCNEHISKPIEWDRLFLSLSELLAGARAEPVRQKNEPRMDTDLHG